MLPSGRSVGKQIFACDEGVMWLHNDRRTGGNMPATDRLEVICSILLIYFYICFKAGKRLNGYKATFCLVYSGHFSPCSCGHVHKVQSFVTCRKSTQAIRPWRQHLSLNKLLQFLKLRSRYSSEYLTSFSFIRLSLEATVLRGIAITSAIASYGYPSSQKSIIAFSTWSSLLISRCISDISSLRLHPSSATSVNADNGMWASARRFLRKKLTQLFRATR